MFNQGQPIEMVTKNECNQGFTLVEIMIALVTIGILSGISIFMYKEQIKKAYATEVKTQLSAASKKLITSVYASDSIPKESCLDVAGLSNSNNFGYSCKMRDDGSNIFDISVKPRRDLGVGGLISFGIGYEKICWDSCDATGFGESAQLAKTHFELSDNCSALTRQETDYDCNCTETVSRECLYYPGGRRTKPRRPPLCGLWICKGWDKPRCRSVATKTCDTCTEVSYVNESGSD